MKTDISIPDPVFEAAEQLARQRGISRGQLYAEALTEFIVRHQSITVASSGDSPENPPPPVTPRWTHNPINDEWV